MKLFVVLAVVVCANGAKLNRNYLPPTFAQSSGGSDFLETPKSGQRGFNSGFNHPNDYAKNSFSNDFVQRPERPQASFERNAAILRYDNENDGEKYAYAYETENGIYAEENGIATNGVNAQGGYSYVGDDGKTYSVKYTADENGFRPEGDHLPTPPPVPEEILRALEQNARDEAAGIYDDGSYNEGKYGGNNAYSNNAYNSNNGYNYDQASNAFDGVVVNAQPAQRQPSYNSFNNNGFRRPATKNAFNTGNLRSYLPPRNY